MSNIARTDRVDPLTFTTEDDEGTQVLTTTHGKMDVTEATEADLGTDTRGSAIGNAHFSLVASGSGRRPPRYLDVLAVATGSDAANTDALVYVEFWHAVAEQWVSAEPFRAVGDTVEAAAAAADPAEYIGEIHTVKVPRGATLARFYVSGLAADQGLDLTADADNDD